MSMIIRTELTRIAGEILRFGVTEQSELDNTLWIQNDRFRS